MTRTWGFRGITQENEFTSPSWNGESTREICMCFWGLRDFLQAKFLWPEMVRAASSLASPNRHFFFIRLRAFFVRDNDEGVLVCWVLLCTTTMPLWQKPPQPKWGPTIILEVLHTATPRKVPPSIQNMQQDVQEKQNRCCKGMYCPPVKDCRNKIGYSIRNNLSKVEG